MSGPRGAWPSARADAGSETAADIRAIRALLPYLWPAGQPTLQLRILIAVLLLVGAKLANVTVPLFYKAAVDALAAIDLAAAGTAAGAMAATAGVPVLMILGYGGMRVSAQVCQELREFVFARVAQRAIRTVGLQTFRHLHALSLRFHLDRQTGGLSRAIERGTKGIEYLLSLLLFVIVPTLLEIALVCGILWALYDWRFAVTTFTAILGYIFYTLAITEWRGRFRREMNETDSEASTKAVDSLLNYETVKYFGNEEHEAARFDEALKRYETAAVKSRTSLSLLNAGQGLIISIGLVIVMIMAGQGVAAGTMTVGDFVLVNAYLIQLYIPLNFLGTAYREIKQSLIDMEAMFKLLGVEREVEDAPGAKPLTVTGGSIEFRDVCFGYHPDRPILKGVSFTVPAGHTVAIVGPSGAGKSTISRLLFRFYDVDSGSILIDGVDVRDVTQASVRRAIGMVPQDTVLFNDTVLYNIAYGRPGATTAQVEEAARLARIHDFVVAMPDGYQTKVGERGLKLSGGEKQRVAIARTILKAPSIFLFDEATSALDTATEKEIQASLSEVSRDRTTLMIAHRLSTVVDADKIIVLRDGRIAEEGGHAALLAKPDGIYKGLWERQQAGYDLDRGPKAGQLEAEPIPE